MIFVYAEDFPIPVKSAHRQEPGKYQMNRKYTGKTNTQKTFSTAMDPFLSIIFIIIDVKCVRADRMANSAANESRTCIVLENWQRCILWKMVITVRRIRAT